MDAVEELARVANALKIEQEEDLRLHSLALESRSIQDRRRAGLTWFPLKITDTGFGLGSYPYLVVENPGEKVRHQFQSSAPVALFSQAEGSVGEKINGIIGYVDDQRMKIIFYVDELPDWVDNGKLGVNLLFDSRSYDEMWKAMNALINVSKGRLMLLRDTILGYRIPQFAAHSGVYCPSLNESQNEALRLILEAEDVAFIHGPPGTGKTTTLVEGIRELVKRGEQVLVCAPSNAAVDHLTRSIARSGVSVVRIGNLARIGEDTTGYTLDVLLENQKEFRQIRDLKKKAAELRRVGGKYKRQFGKEEADQRKLIFREAKEMAKEARELESYLVTKIISSAQVVTCTLIGSAHDYLRDMRFQTVIIDEAGQGIEPACWVPVQRAEKVIMAGDPLQLPPTVKSSEAERLGLAVTLLEKGVQRHDRIGLLRTQYRMHEDIMGFSSDWFYKGLLEAHESVRHAVIPGMAEVFEFVDTAGCGYEEVVPESSESRSNPEEAALIRRHFDRMKLMCPGVNDVGIISPYRAQIDLLIEAFADVPGVIVNTIDSFQGQERDVIYISLVRSNEKGEIGFLRDYRRLNVALTRARRKLVVIGDSATLGNDLFYQAFLDYAEKKGAWKTAWEWMEG